MNDTIDDSEHSFSTEGQLVRRFVLEVFVSYKHFVTLSVTKIL